MAGSTPLPPKSSVRAAAVAMLAALVVAALPPPPVRAETGINPYRVVADAIPDSLTGRPGDARRGRAIVVDRQQGLCLLCHSGPFPEVPLQGDLAPDLTGAGERWTAGQLRLRIVDASRVDAQTIMLAYYRTDGLLRVAPAFAGKPILTAEQIEDVVAFLVTLRP